MAYIIKNGYCKIHGDTKVEIEKKNHLLHLLLSILTGGIWVLVWFLLGNGTARCSICGRKAKV